LTVAAVPTGMKAGVRISPRCIWMVPVRALPSRAWMLWVMARALRARPAIWTRTARASSVAAMKKAALLLALLAAPALAADDPLTRPITTSYTDRWMQVRAPIIYGKTGWLVRCI
jgi:hypothetical protein